MALMPFSGCVEKVNQNTQYTDQVTSGDPQRDGKALAEANKQLDGVKYSVLERRGPKPVGAFKVENPPVTNNRKKTARTDHPTARRTQVVTYKQVTPPSTQPTTQPIVEKVTETITEIPDETDLPVDTVYLPDGKIRLIWRLRSFGGPGVASTRDPSTSRRNITLKPADLAPLVAVLTPQIGPTGTVIPLPAENALVITMDPQLKPSVLDLLNKLDTPQRQVEIAAKIFEVSSDFDFQYGAQLIANRIGGTSAQQGSSVFNTPRFLDALKKPSDGPFQGGVVSLMKQFQDAGVSIEASFQALADAGMIKVVSSPRMTVAAGQTGYLLAGQELPIQTANVTNSAVVTNTQYKPIGVQLYITPQAVSEERVKLHAISIVSQVAGFTATQSINGFNDPRGMVNPVIDSREAETAVTVDDGDTLVISGLRLIRTTTRENKVPGLGDLPVLGWLFKNHRTQQQMTDLYFFVTPTLLEVADAK